ncbi:hypothetical protein BEP19_10225 [Ammoniphilus oxalaticus]|uniref:Uncharacterized protein n=1 Tax=Ammoniphilus oxalaticus TaxID=66863 RepID=A0A419SFR7_9BACL|nr:hypothetical protein BEP19_10225 [Ammoniphilus oxalaticus]
MFQSTHLGLRSSNHLKHEEGREELMEQNKNIEIEKKNIEKKSDSSMVASTFIKYISYLIIFFGSLYFINHYVFPLFK